MYELIKAVHIAAMALWVGSMAGVSFTLHAKRGELLSKRLRQLMGAGISLTWLSGMYLVYASGYYVAQWFWVKLLVVIGLSALHGVVAKTLRHSADAGAGTEHAEKKGAEKKGAETSVPLIGGFIVAGVALVAYLVVAKPF